MSDWGGSRFRRELRENDEISDSEEGFMLGYEHAFD